MPHSLTNFLAAATLKAAADLKAAVERVPVDRRSWKPMDKGRSALDQAAECAMSNGYMVGFIETRAWEPSWDFAAYLRQKAELAEDWTAVQELLDRNTSRVIETIRSVPETDLQSSLALPSRTLTLAEAIAYPYWNMSYHEGQINYIASMLGTL